MSKGTFPPTNAAEFMANMQGAFEHMLKPLGATVVWNADADLSTSMRGDPLTWGEYRKLKEGDIVWYYYKEHGEDEPRADGPYRLEPTNDGIGWILKDESNFTTDWYDDDSPDDAEVKDDEYGAKLYKVWQPEVEGPFNRVVRPFVGCWVIISLKEHMGTVGTATKSAFLTQKDARRYAQSIQAKSAGLICVARLEGAFF